MMKKVLFISLKRMGDVILTTPAVRRLKRALPEVSIDFLVYPEFASILEGNPYIRRVILYPKTRPWRLPGLLRSERYDWALDFLTTGSSSWASFLCGAPKRVAFVNSHPRWIHNIQIPHPLRPLYGGLKKQLLLEPVLREGLGSDFHWDDEKEWKPEIFVSEARLKHWALFLEQEGWKKPGQPLVMMSPVSRKVTRRWSLAGYAEVARRLAVHDRAKVLCLWGPGEREQALETVRLADRPEVRVAPAFHSLHDLAAFISNADSLITNCNGTRHIAVARGVPTLTIHMSSDPHDWNPPDPQSSGFHPLHPVLRAEKLFCIGCRRNKCPYRLECSSLLSADEVYERARRLLNRFSLL